MADLTTGGFVFYSLAGDLVLLIHLLLNKSEHSSQAFVLPPEGSKLVIGL
ncbi:MULTISPECIES: hypothetical protein [Marinobacter]|nr:MULTISPECIES: hypothetical protein [Marinobacter]MBL3557726.1 hypothetical protein [Marinobacter sp. JB05H06]